MNDSQTSVRIGPISLFALIAVICLATLAVLSITTAGASLRLASLQADSMTQQYQAELAAQTFVANVDAGYADATLNAERLAAQKAAADKLAADQAARAGQPAPTTSATPADPTTPQPPAAAGSLAESRPAICAEASAATDDVIIVTAQLDGSTINAQFACPSERILDISIELDAGGSYRITKWNMTAKVNSAETETLWSGM